MQSYNSTVFHNFHTDEGPITLDREDGTILHLLILPEFRDVETVLEENERLSYALVDVGHMIPQPAGRFIITWSGKWRYEGDHFSASDLKLIDDQIWYWLDLWN